MSDMQVFQAESLPKALAAVKAAFGPDAVILGTRTIEPQGLGGVLKKKTVEITAQRGGLPLPKPPQRPVAKSVAPREEPPAKEHTSSRRRRIVNAYEPYNFRREEPKMKKSGQPKRPAANEMPSRTTRSRATTERSPNLLKQSYETLVQNEVADLLAQQLLTRVRGKFAAGEGSIDDLVRDELTAMIPTCAGIELPTTGMKTVALIGPPGVGKTTTIAKLAAHFKLREKKNVSIIAADLRRLAAAEQMARYGDLLGVAVENAASVAELEDKMYQQRSAGADVLLIDTPGVSRNDQDRLEQLKVLLQAAAPDETHLVLPVTLADAVRTRMAELFEPLGVTRVILTHIDDALGFGVVANAMGSLRWKLAYWCAGQNVPTDFRSACSADIAHLIFPAVGESRSAAVPAITQEA